MAYRKIVDGRPDAGGAYDIYEVRPIAGAVGGGPQARPPFAPGSPAAMAQAEVGLEAFAADIGSGFVHLYVRVGAAPIAGVPSQNPQGVPSNQPAGQPTQQVTQQLSPRQPPVLREVRGPGPEAVPSTGGKSTWETAVAFFSWLAGAIKTVANVKDWAKLPAKSTPVSVYQMAARAESNLVGVAGLLQGIPGIEGLTWIGKQQDGDWFVPLVGPLFFGFPDVEMSGANAAWIIDPNRVYPEGIAPAGPGVPRNIPNLNPQAGQVPKGAVGALLGVPGVEPGTVVVRRCGKGLRLAIDGMCYPKKLLTAATRANTPKKAPVSYRDAQQITKGRKAEERIANYAHGKGIEPRPKRRRHTHRHTHRED